MFSFFKKQDFDMWLFVGLGNPEDEHARHRHNIGFMAVDAMADGDYNFPPFRSKFQGLITEMRIEGEKVALLKPQTYMNESGQSVGECAKFYKIPPERIIVLHDELDLNPGAIKIKQGGGTAGHNGLKSIQAHLGTPDFWRVRMGIGHPGDKNRVSGYVLSDFSKSEEEVVKDMLDATCERYSLVLKDGPESWGKDINATLKSWQAERKTNKG